MKVKVTRENYVKSVDAIFKAHTFFDLPDFIELEAEPVEGEKVCTPDRHWNCAHTGGRPDHPKLPDELNNNDWPAYRDDAFWDRDVILMQKINEILRFLKARE